MTNPEVYPITAGMEKDLKDCLDHESVQQIVEVVGEYEHGTADVEDVFPEDLLNLLASCREADDLRQLLLRTYAAVAQDLALSLESWS